MHTLIAFASQWGSKYGGINSFNTDFLKAFSAAYGLHAQTICVVTGATIGEIEEAARAQIRLIPLPFPPEKSLLTAEHAQVAIGELQKHHISFEARQTVWLGHDRITGEAAITAAKAAGGRSALIHHMSYDHYESFAENSQCAYAKKQMQDRLFEQADLLLAVGPLLRDAAKDRVSPNKAVHMIIPGLAEIESRPTPTTFSAFLSGRLSDDAARIKQGHLGIAAFAHAHKQARQQRTENGLHRSPKLLIRGVSFESAPKNGATEPETELKKFAYEYADAVFNLQALPYTLDREILYNDLSGSTVAIMPSWHEGFGLVAWEAIAAGVPLILSENSGVYKLLKENHPGTERGFVFPVDVRGANDSPYFHTEDLEIVAEAITDIAKDPGRARKQASALRSQLSDYTWAKCVEGVAAYFDWPLRVGSIAEVTTQTTNSIQFVEPGEPTNHSPLHMPQKRWRADGSLPDSWLLRAEEAQVPFDSARQPELNALHQWLSANKYPLAIRLITGVGGLGKTRLALQLCNQAITGGWHAGMLDSDLTDKEVVNSWQRLQELKQPLLVVMDYAETRQNTLLRLIKAILKSPIQHAVRILLLARNGGEWWDNLPAKDSQCEAILSGYATSGPHTLAPLYQGVEQRQNAYKQALSSFAETLNIDAPKIIPDLNSEHFGHPLYLQMAALLALRGEQPNSAYGLTKALLNHERRYWKKLFANTTLTEPERYCQQLMALTTLVGGYSTAKEALGHWRNSHDKLLSDAEFANLFAILTPLYPGKQGLQPVRPDLLGEALVAETLLRGDDNALLNTVLGKSASQTTRRNALTILSRLTSQRSEFSETLIPTLTVNMTHCVAELVAVAKETPGKLPTVAIHAFAQLTLAEKSQTAGILGPFLAEESVELVQLNVVVTEYLVNKAFKKLQHRSRDTALQAEYAGQLNNYSIALARIGQTENATKQAYESLEIRKCLSQLNSHRHESDYANSLSNTANTLYEAGQYQEALKYAKQALEIQKRLTQKNSDRHDPDYATSLSNIATYLSEAGQYDEALKYAKQALEIREHLSQKNPDCHEPDYATSLSNTANDLSEVGQYDEALKYAKQALEIREHLSQKNPDCHEPDYATSLSNTANDLSEVGQYDEALKYAKQALEIREHLSQKNPDCHEPDYATSLSNTANHLSATGQDEEALKYSKQALDIRRRLTQKNPDRHEPAYAYSLSNTANHLSEAGQDEEALQSAEQALQIRKRLTQKNPDRHEPEYATSLSNIATYLNEAGQCDEALKYAKQALEIRRRLTQKNPDRHEPAYATSLGNTANHLSAVGQDEEAVKYAKQALKILERLAQKSPDRHEPNYATSLSNTANHLSAAGQYDEAFKYAQQALKILERLTQKSPARHARLLFDCYYSAVLFKWLSRQVTAIEYLPDISPSLDAIPKHNQLLSIILRAFVQGCLTLEAVERRNLFQQIIAQYETLATANKMSTKEIWLVAAAWCATHAPASERNSNWKDEYQRFNKQRKGNTPRYMVTIADRLGFKWPNSE